MRGGPGRFRTAVRGERVNEAMMEIPVDIWLRGENHATTLTIAPVSREPGAWTDSDVGAVLTAMLRALESARHPETDPDRPITLRGFSWIVNPYHDGGVVIAIELSLGAVVAGPFDIAESELSAMIERVLTWDRGVPSVAPTDVIH
jgi:hypothetical protein